MGMRMKKGYLFDDDLGDWVHRQRAREMLGREIPRGAHVHHPDRDPWNPYPRVAVMPASVHRKHHHWARDGYDYVVCWRCGGIGHWARNCWR